MSFAEDVDVVVVGFGLAGASAALAAAGAGARVQVLSGRRSHIRRRSLLRPACGPHAVRLAVQTAALEAGVEVRTPSTAHELLVDGGSVVGVGYASLEAGSAAELAHRCLQRVAERTQPPLRSLGAAWSGVADALWEQASSAGAIGCSSVVLALDPSHWEFVGPAVWASLRAAERSGETSTGSGRRGRLALVSGVPAPADPVGAERTVREWCAAQFGTSCATGGQPDLRVDGLTGRVLTEDGHQVTGLYSAFSEPGDLSANDVHGLERCIAVGRRAGTAAAVSTRCAIPHLRSVV